MGKFELVDPSLILQQSSIELLQLLILVFKLAVELQQPLLLRLFLRQGPRLFTNDFADLLGQQVHKLTQLSYPSAQLLIPVVRKYVLLQQAERSRNKVEAIAHGAL